MIQVALPSPVNRVAPRLLIPNLIIRLVSARPEPTVAQLQLSRCKKELSFKAGPSSAPQSVKDRRSLDTIDSCRIA